MNNFETITKDIDTMAKFLKKVNCSEYDLFSGIWSCEMCIYYTTCTTEESDILPYIEWLQSEAVEG